MAKLGWKIAMLCSSMLMGGCGDDEDTGDSRPMDQPEYGTFGITYQVDPAEGAKPLPAAQTPAQTPAQKRPVRD